MRDRTMHNLSFIEKPNLPQGKVRLIFVGESYINRLNTSKFGIDCIPISDYTHLEPAICSHADTQVVHLYRNNFITIPNIACKVNKLYTKHLGINKCLKVNVLSGKKNMLYKYPDSASYNVLLIDKFAIYNPKCIDPVLEEILKSNYKCLYVSQGYVRCASCIVDETAIITADTSIANTLKNVGIDVLLISPGFIDLPNYNYGFIGGATFKIDKHKLAFTGTIDNHPDKTLIIEFLQKHRVEPVFLSDTPIFDIGSAIPVLEER